MIQVDERCEYFVCNSKRLLIKRGKEIEHFQILQKKGVENVSRRLYVLVS